MKKLYSFILINLGVILVSIGIVFFKVPNNFATGGVTGISIIINKLEPVFSVGTLMLIINIALLAMGMLFAGFEFELKTMYSTILISLVVWFLEKKYPIKSSLTGDMMLELFLAILLLGAGSAILFYQNASSGGTDIIAKILNQKTHWHIGKTVLIVDLTISMFAIFIFGLKIGFYSILGVVLKGFLIDAVIQGLHSSKQILIISNKSEEIKIYILHELRRGVTIFNAIGGNTNSERQVINTVMSSKEAVRLRKYIKKIDTKAFMIVDNVSEIYGKGFI
ncbi:MAG: YitT family protein [Bacillota bacterium]|nr:YitT family protein [Bacillota bacterium]